MTRDEKKAILEDIRARHPEQKLLAGDVVSAAKSKAHPLHNHFEWDDKKASHAFRLVQARNLIRTVVILNPEAARPKPQPVYVSLVSDRGKPGGGYRTLDEVATSNALKKELIANAMRDLQAWAARYRLLENATKATFRYFEEIIDEMVPSRMAAD